MLRAFQLQFHEISLSSHVFSPLGSPITNYVVQMKQGNGDFFQLYSGLNMSVAVYSLQSNTLYYFKVKAENPLGESPYSQVTSKNTNGMLFVSQFLVLLSICLYLLQK